VKLDRKAILEILQERLNRIIKARISREVCTYLSILIVELIMFVIDASMLAKFAGRVFEASFTIDKSAFVRF
jgi:hypothetical protein